MALRVGIVGLTNSGKTTIFNCFSNTKAETSVYSFSTNKSNLGKTDVPDPRLSVLTELVPTRKIVYATMEFVDIPGLTKGASQGQGIGNSFLNDVRNADALLNVVRCFDDENLPHIDGSVNPVRDIETLDLELQVKDLESVEKRLVKAEKRLKVGEKTAKAEVESLHKFKEQLENMRNIRNLELDENDKALLKEMFLLTAKPVMYVCNVDDDSAVSGNQYSKAVEKYVAENDPDSNVLIIAAQMEAEISELDPEDREEFLKDAGLSEPGVNKLIRAAYSLLNLQTFFTVGKEENRAWTIKKGMTAPEAAGVIHSDLKRGFIRAEVIAYDDFVKYGSEAACREHGKLRLEGKDYVVQEGDILHIRFNV